MKKLALLAALAALPGCGGSGGGGGTASSTDATLNLGVTDAPIMRGIDQISNVFVQFHGVELHGPSGTTTINFDAPKQIDLLTYSGTNAAALLEGTALPAGDYQWIRLLVDTGGTLDTYIVDGTGTHELTIPSGAQTGLKLVQGFTLAQGDIANFTIDFNIAHSLGSNASGYFLKPTLRLVDNTQAGVLIGNVSPTLITAHCSDGGSDAGAVYIYSGAVTPTDISGATTDPVTTARVTTDGTYAYTIGFLSPGSYTVAWTCDEGADDPQQVDTLNFFGTTAVTIAAHTTISQNF